MTCGERLRDGTASPEAKNNGDYVLLGAPEYHDSVVVEGLPREQDPRLRSSLWWWGKVVLSCAVLLVVGAVCLIWGGPLLIRKVVVPVLDWETTTFDRPTLGLILFVSIATFPVFLVPTSPCTWLAGMTFGYGYGFLLIMGASSLGMSLPFFIGSLFRHRIHRWLDRWPKKSAIVRLAGEGNWFHQFRAVALIRISPFPFIIFNYAAVATNVKYCPYIVGSLTGTTLETFVTIYTGILIGNLAEASHGRGFLSVEQIIYDVLGFCTAAGATVAITCYAKKALRRLQAEDELL
ncbi:uncharacterized protein LOC144714774 [Wolffia australiana]